MHRLALALQELHRELPFMLSHLTCPLSLNQLLIWECGSLLKIAKPNLCLLKNKKQSKQLPKSIFRSSISEFFNFDHHPAFQER